jgi:acetyl esterase/lipase
MMAAMAIAVAGCAAAQQPDAATWAARAAGQYNVIPNITYLAENNVELKLDIFRRKDTRTPQPTMISIHGGGWTGGTRDGLLFLIMPWFEMGYNVINVDYRMAHVSTAPAAVEDCLCALRWVGAHAQTYGIDVNKLVLNGDSAGGHLSLTTGMIPESAGLDRECPGGPMPKVAAIVNWYGITDVNDLLEGPNQRSYAVTWLGSAPDREEIAKRVSPLTYVRPGLPPILTIHGDADPTVPYTQALRLQDALEKAGVPHQLVTVPGGKHGNFTMDDYVRAFGEVRKFLGKYDLLPQ